VIRKAAGQDRHQVGPLGLDLVVDRETRGVLAGPEGAAIRLGMKRTTLQYKIKKLAIAQNEWWPAAAD